MQAHDNRMNMHKFLFTRNFRKEQFNLKLRLTLLAHTNQTKNFKISHINIPKKSRCYNILQKLYIYLY